MFRPLWKNLINLVYPLSCLICKVRLAPLSDKPICEDCWNKIEYNLPPFCRVCGKHLPAKSQNQAFICKDCQGSVYFYSRVYSVCIYDGIIKECIHLLKYKSKLSLVKSLSKLMTDFADKFLNMKNINLVLPVPLSSAKLRQRQFNQAKFLAKSLSRTFTKKIKESLLVKTRSGPAQVGLSKAERLKNVQGAFKIKNNKELKYKNILLVDDVFTTGATANECARVLLNAGAKRVDVFTLAHNRGRFSD